MSPFPSLPAAALLFDMDGVLVDSRAVVERTWRRWAARHGIDAEPLLRAAHGRRTRETLQEVAPHLATTEEVAWLDAAELADYEGLAAVPGAARLLAALAGIPWAVVTSAGPELARRRLGAAGLPLPPVLVSSDDVAHGKPAPDGYLLAAERLSVAAGRAVVLEDAPPGVAAARAAGSTVIGIATTHAPAQLVGARFVVPDLMPITVEQAGVSWRILVHPVSARLALVLRSRKETRAMIDALSPSEKAELSADWLARINASDTADPWTDAYSMVLRQSGAVVGRCGFKGPPAGDGMVEIAYGVEPEHQGKGYATEAAKALTDHAFASGAVRVVRAHTLPESNASTRVLTRCGYHYVGEVIDPEDGLVWRWERKNEKPHSLLDDIMPDCDVSSRHTIRIAAKPADVFNVVRRADLGRPRLVRALLALRAVPAGLASLIRPRRPVIPPETRRSVGGLGFTIVAENPGEELVLGLMGRFWTLRGGVVPSTAEQFRHPPPSGLAQAVWNFRVVSDGGGTVLSTETRVRCGDAASRGRFLRYWRVVRLGSALTRMSMLRYLQAEAERRQAAP